MSIHNRLLFLVTDRHDDGSLWNDASYPDVNNHNATGMDHDTNEMSSGGTAATVVVLSMLVLLLLICAVICVQYETVKKQEEPNSASDGNTVASVEDIDCQEGCSKALEVNEQEEEIQGPMVIVIRVSG